MEKLPTSSKALRYLPFLVASAFFMQMLDATILNTAIPTIARSFNSHPLQLHSLVTAYMLTVCVLMPASGWISDKLGSRRTFLLAISVFSVGSLLCALSASVTMMTVCRVIQGIGGAFLMPVGRLVILRSYPRSMFVNVLNIVTIPALLGPLLGQTLIEKVGAQMTCRILAIVFLIGVGIAAAMIVPCPEGWTPEGWKPSAEQAKVLKTRDYSMGEMVKTPVFWVLLLMFIFANAAGTMMVSFTSPIAQRQVGQTAMTAALCVSIMTLANMCGRIGFGFIYDILKGWKSLILLMVINGVSMLMLTQATTLPFFIVCVVLVGFSFGGLLVVFAPMVRMIFGSKFYNRNYGLIFIGYGIGAFVGPKISAYFYDTTGQYTLGFIGSAILAVAAIVLIVIAQKMAGKMENAQ